MSHLKSFFDRAALALGYLPQKDVTEAVNFLLKKLLNPPPPPPQPSEKPYAIGWIVTRDGEVVKFSTNREKMEAISDGGINLHCVKLVKIHE